MPNQSYTARRSVTAFGQRVSGYSIGRYLSCWRTFSSVSWQQGTEKVKVDSCAFSNASLTHCDLQFGPSVKRTCPACALVDWGTIAVRNFRALMVSSLTLKPSFSTVNPVQFEEHYTIQIL